MRADPAPVCYMDDSTPIGARRNPQTLETM